MAEHTQTEISHSDVSAGAGAGDDITTTTVYPSTNPFLTSNPSTITSESHPQSQFLNTPEHQLPDPFSPDPQAQQKPTEQQEQTETLPQLPPRPDQSYFPQLNSMATDTSVLPRDTTTPTAPEEQHARTEDANVQVTPEVATLKAMFPDFDSAVLLSVLQSVDHNQDRAVDLLLGMSDPDYVSTQPASQPSGDPNGPATALALDEQLARQLALEDEQESQRHSRRRTGTGGRDQGQPPRATGQSWPRRGDGANAQQGAQQGQTEGNEKGDFSEFQETVSRIAESGKRTFSSLVSKVKAKIGEMDQNRNAQQSSSSSAQPHPYEDYNGSQSPPIDRHAASEAFAYEYYGTGTNNPQSVNNQTTGGWTGTPHNQEVRGYDVGGNAYGGTTSQPVSIPTPTPTTPPAGAGIASSPGNDALRPPPTSQGSPINPAKLGLLPKRPVSLMGSQPTPGQAAPSPPVRRDDDDDELEYMENPFEEGRR